MQLHDLKPSNQKRSEGVERGQLRRVRIDARLLVSMFASGNQIHATVSEGLPEDATLYDAFIEHQNGRIVTLIVQSPEFDPVDEGGEIPVIEPVITELSQVARDW